jgi:predicted O-methyltransferase YrrM
MSVFARMPRVVRLMPLRLRAAVAAVSLGIARIVIYRIAARLRVGISLAPLNGQKVRQETIAAIVEDFAPDAVIETGTFLGDSTRHFAGLAPTVFSAEVDPSFVMTAWLRLRGHDNVTLVLADSREALRHIGQRGVAARPLIYLDSHWYDDLPLPEEIEIVARSWEDAIVVIDDFAVPDDPGYRFDRYEGGRIDLASCSFGPEYTAFLPAQPSESETGHVRGTCYAGLRGGRVPLDQLVDQGILRTA